MFKKLKKEFKEAFIDTALKDFNRSMKKVSKRREVQYIVKFKLEDKEGFSFRRLCDAKMLQEALERSKANIDAEIYRLETDDGYIVEEKVL